MSLRFHFDQEQHEARVAASDRQGAQERAAAALQALIASPPGFLSELEDTGLIPAVRSVADAMPDADAVVVLGIGGSSLGARTLYDALAPAGAPRFVFLDNIDPATIEALDLPWARTQILMVSKSGSTAETIAQFLFLRGRMENAGVDWRQQVTVITDPERGPLRELVREHDLRSLPVPPGVGGRFSVLTAVGLLPAALMGIDLDALLGGARAVARDLGGATGGAIAHLAAHHFATYRSGRAIQVLLSYSDRLRTLGAWFAQLWGESLGKRLDRSGAEVWTGSTPLPAVGATDQHSLVQLFREGPDDKQYWVLGHPHPGPNSAAPAAIPADAAEVHPDFGYLAGSSLAELFDAERRGTIGALREAGRPVVEIAVDAVDARHVGALFVVFEVLTAIGGDLYDVDPYDQPGVEAGKVAAFALMGREGYADKGRELLAILDREPGPAFQIDLD